MDRNLLASITISAVLHASLLLGDRPEKVVTATSAPLPPSPRIEIYPASPVNDELPMVSGVTTELGINSAIDWPSTSTICPIDDADGLCPIGGPLVPGNAPSALISAIPAGLPDWSASLIGLTYGTLVPADLDGPPRTRVQTPPPYPVEATHTGATGTVMVEFTVDEMGGVLNPRVVSSTHSIFNAAAVQGISRWKFEPGKRNGRVVRFKMMVPIVFALNDQ
jgi:protein TonB